MSLAYYNEEVDKILFDIIGNDSFIESELKDLVDHVVDTIYQYNKKLKKSQLELVVGYLIENKYQKSYEYNANSEFNKTIDKNDSSSDNKNNSSSNNKNNSSSNNKNDSSSNNKNDSDIISINMSDIEDDGSCVDGPTKYINPELDVELMGDKVHLSCAKDLVSHRHDYGFEEFKEEKYNRRRKRIIEIKKIPQFEQKSTEWLGQRGKCLTATAIATALDEDPYKYPAELLLDKCDRGAPFVENEYVHHGKKYEEIGNMFYSFRNNIIVAEYGLIQDNKYKFIGASPDGICEKKTMESDKLSSLVGRLLEIKFPKIRKILTEGDLDGDICPHYYYVQVQTQLFVTKMDECDFLQCQIEEYDSWEDFVKDSHPNIPGLSKKTNLEKGCLIQLLPKKMISNDDPKMCLFNGKYIYPPKLHMTHEEIITWIANEVLQFHQNDLSKNYVIDRIIYWRLSQVTCHLIKADAEWFDSKIPQLKQFWNYVLLYKKYPKKLDSLVKYIEEIGSRKTAEIFKRVHKDYLSVRQDSTYTPLYQKENPWRIKYNKKYEKWQKFQDHVNKKNNFSNATKKKI